MVGTSITYSAQHRRAARNQTRPPSEASEQQNEQLLQLSNQILELTKAIHAMNSAR